MSRSKIQVTITPRVTPEGNIELTLRHMLNESITKHEAMVMDLHDQATRAALIALGWTPPAASGGQLFDPAQIDKQLWEIGGTAPNSPMISYQGEGNILVGGVVNTAQLVALAALSSRCVR